MTPSVPVPPQGFEMVAREDRVRLVRADASPALARLMDQPFEQIRALPGAQSVAAGRAGPVHIQVPGEPRRVFVRPYAHGGILGGTRQPGFADPARAWSELAVNARALEQDLPVLPLLGVTGWHRPDGMWEMEAWSWWNADALDLLRCLPPLAAAPPARQSLLHAVAGAIRQCHDAGLVHADLNARNILVERVSASWKVMLIDLDKARFQARLDRPARLAQVRRLYRSFAKEGLVPASLPDGDQTAFVRDCAGGTMSDAEIVRFLAGCRRAVFWHSLLWRLHGRPSARAVGA